MLLWLHYYDAMQTAVYKTIDHLFRQEAGRLTAVLSKLLGLQYLETASDIVQDTLLQALNTWTYNGLPENPTAWLHRVAKNKAIDFLRRQKNFHNNISPQYSYLLQCEYIPLPAINELFEEDQIQDSQLRMIFACCHPSIPVESQLALALKTLCGLSVSEISRAFLTREDTIAKRIFRAKEKIRLEKIELQLPPSAELHKRIDAVLHCLYLLFTEGYNSAHPVQLIREELCEEAMRLAYLLTQNNITNLSRTNAMLALFCFQASRLPARLDEGGNIILLKHQDRSLWYQPLIKKGFEYLDKATDKETSIYHLEAAIAYYHAVATSFEKTNWRAIYNLYSILNNLHHTPFIALNKAIASLYAINAATALKELNDLSGLDNYYLYHTALGEAYFESGFKSKARDCYTKALNLTVSNAEKQLLELKVKSCG